MDQQPTDEFTIYGILPEVSARGKIKFEDLRSMIQDYLQLGPIYTLLVKILKEEFKLELLEKIRLDIPIIFKGFNSVTFLKEVPPFINNRVTRQNIRIIKSAIHIYSLSLLTMQEIKDATLVFQLKEMEHMSEGLPCEIPIINSMLWKINKTISNKVLEEWIKRCQDFLEIKGVIQAFEFLFLTTNTLDRRNFYNKIPKATLDISRDPKFRLFQVDSTGFTTLKNPDTKIQQYMNYQYNIEKANFQGRSVNDRNEYYQQKRQQRFEGFLKKQTTSQDEFKKLLKDPELYVEIKTKIKNAQQLLNHSKLNGKMLRAQLKEELGYDFNEHLHPPPQQDLVDKVRELPSYRMAQSKRPQSAAYDKIKSEVGVHRQMASDAAFMTQYMGMKRNPSATTAETKRNRSSLSQLTRPQTGQPSIKKRDSIITKKSPEAIFDEELTNYEKQTDNGDDEPLVFYGSSNSTQRQFTINLPWSASTRRT